MSTVFFLECENDHEIPLCHPDQVKGVVDAIRCLFQCPLAGGGWNKGCVHGDFFGIRMDQELEKAGHAPEMIQSYEKWHRYGYYIDRARAVWELFSKTSGRSEKEIAVAKTNIASNNSNIQRDPFFSLDTKKDFDDLNTFLFNMLEGYPEGNTLSEDTFFKLFRKAKAHYNNFMKD